MKKVVASLGPNPNDPIAENAARAPYFLVFEDDKFVEAVKNPFTM
jgi:predicted Fe-Mo cluster-binding NifX family protein